MCDKGRMPTTRSVPTGKREGASDLAGGWPMPGRIKDDTGAAPLVLPDEGGSAIWTRAARAGDSSTRSAIGGGLE